MENWKEIREKYQTTLRNVVLIISGLTALEKAFISSRKLDSIFLVSLGVILVFFFYQLYESAKRRRLPTVRHNTLPAEANQIRGMQPFEVGQFIIGRDYEIRQLITIIENRDFTFGYISGEAGAGKTSIIRAGLLTYLRDKDWTIFYFPSISDVIDQGFHNRDEGITSVFTESFRNQLAGLSSNRPSLVILDQFEELFVAKPRRLDRVRVSEEISRIITHFNLRILLCLRKEFVEDLRSFSSGIKNPKSDDYSVYVENWEAEKAKKYFELMCEKDGIHFSEQLREFVVEDVAVSGIVKPIELQIVSKYCIESKIQTVTEYRQVGKSQGILKNFIFKALQIDSTNIQSHSFAVGGYILRMLCDELYDTKRTDGGVTYLDLQRQVKSLVGNRFKGLKEEEYKNLFSKVLERLIDYKLVIRLSDDKYNLCHDYLVKGIREITTGLQTSEELAILMLERFFSARDHRIRSFLTFKEYRFIRKNLPQSAYTSLSTREVLRKQARYYRRNVAASLITVLATCTFFFPPSISYSIKEIKSARGIQDEYDKNSPFNTDWTGPVVKYRDSTYQARIAPLANEQNVADLYPIMGSEIHPTDRGYYFRAPLLPGALESVGNKLFVIDTGRTRLSYFGISKLPVLEIISLSIPPIFSQEKKLVNIVNHTEDRIYYSHRFASMFVDTIAHSFFACNRVALAYTLNYLNEPIKAFAFDDTGRPKNDIRMVGISEIAGDYYVNTADKPGGAFIVRRKDGKVHKVSENVRTLFSRGWIAYTRDFRYLYLYDTTANEIRVYPPNLPADSADLAAPLFSFWVNSSFTGPNMRFGKQPFEHEGDELAAGNHRYLKVVRLDSAVYFAVLYSMYGTSLYLASPSGSKQLPNRQMSFPSGYGFSTASTYDIVLYGRGTDDEMPILVINKADLSVRNDIRLSIIAVKDIDSAELNLIYLDSAGYYNSGIFQKDDSKIQSKTRICLSSFMNDACAYWSDDKRYIFFVGGQGLYFGSRTGHFGQILDFTQTAVTRTDGISQFFVRNKDLYVQSYKQKYVIRRWATLWGLKLWALDWPPIHPVERVGSFYVEHDSE